MKALNREKIPDEAKIGRMVTIRVIQFVKPPFDDSFAAIVVTMLKEYVRGLESGEMGTAAGEVLQPNGYPNIRLEADGSVVVDAAKVPPEAYEEVDEQAPIRRHPVTGESIN